MRLENLSFKGGTHIHGHKELSSHMAIEQGPEPEMVYIPLHQHVGASCDPLVKRGDTVKVGQKIGDSDSYITAPVHSSVSGTVRRIEKIHTPDGFRVDCVVIESDGEYSMDESVQANGDYDSMSPDQLVSIIREAGIAGMGGAAFPTHAKLASGIDDKVKDIILNGAECEPYLTTDYRLMLEKPELIVQGLEVIGKILDSDQLYIAIEDDKMEAVASIEEASKENSDIKVAVMKTKFPQGDSYRIINSVLGKVVPQGGRCKDVGALVNNVGTTAAIAEAVFQGKPLYERVVTVTGDAVKEPKNIMVKIGTTVEDVLKQCGGFSKKPGKIIVGGPMTGFAQFSLNAPVTKGTTGILVLSEEAAKIEKVLPCIKCGKCLEVCAVHLEPLNISAAALKDKFELAESLNALACIECGSCSYICPSKRPVSESILYAKNEIKAKNRK